MALSNRNWRTKTEKEQCQQQKQQQNSTTSSVTMLLLSGTTLAPSALSSKSKTFNEQKCPILLSNSSWLSIQLWSCFVREHVQCLSPFLRVQMLFQLSFATDLQSLLLHHIRRERTKQSWILMENDKKIPSSISALCKCWHLREREQLQTIPTSWLLDIVILKYMQRLLNILWGSKGRWQCHLQETRWPWRNWPHGPNWIKWPCWPHRPKWPLRPQQPQRQLHQPRRQLHWQLRRLCRALPRQPWQAYQRHQPCRLHWPWPRQSAYWTHRSHRLCNCSKNNIMEAQESSGTRSCHIAIKCYQNRWRGILLLCLLIASCVFAREGEDVVVACSCQEKDVAVYCLFWRLLSRWRVTICKTIFLSGFH